MAPWWQEAVFYQIYPRSFADGDGDGLGDFAGMIARLDYLAELGIDALWLSPHFPSPQFDCGYDVADYTNLAPEYGTLDDFQRFLEGAHQRGLRVILDLVLNHTSHLHPWFVQSRRGRDDPRRDWYIWRDGRDGGPPNNWLSTFGGPAWELDPATGQYYYHFFFKQQPDLNWRNPAVKDAMFAAARFWLDRGVDGFRLDALGTLLEDPALPDHTAKYGPVDLLRRQRAGQARGRDPVALEQWKLLFKHQIDLPGVHAILRELRAVIDEYDERVLVGETDDLAYHGRGDDELHLVFNFPLMRTRSLTPAWVRANQARRLAALPAGAWPCNTLGNHDTPRIYSRYADGAHDEALARLALALMLTLRGTPFLYNGEEIGMTDLLLERVDQFRDLIAVWRYQVERDALVTAAAEAVALAAAYGRDKCRTPMQWSRAPQAGFCPAEVEPWLPVNPNYASGRNVADQQADPDSLLSFYRRLLRLRRVTPALRLGGYQPLDEAASAYLACLRPLAGAPTCLVVLNWSATAHSLALDLGLDTVRPIFSTRARPPVADPRHLDLAPFEIFIAEL